MSADEVVQRHASIVSSAANVSLQNVSLRKAADEVDSVACEIVASAVEDLLKYRDEHVLTKCCDEAGLAVEETAKTIEKHNVDRGLILLHDTVTDEHGVAQIDVMDGEGRNMIDAGIGVGTRIRAWRETLIGIGHLLMKTGEMTEIRRQATLNRYIIIISIAASTKRDCHKA